MLRIHLKTGKILFSHFALTDIIEQDGFYFFHRIDAPADATGHQMNWDYLKSTGGINKTIACRVPVDEVDLIDSFQIEGDD